MTEYLSDEEIVRERRRERLKKMKYLKERQMRRRKLLKITVPVVIGILGLIVVGVKFLPQQLGNRQQEEKIQQSADSQQTVTGKTATDAELSAGGAMSDSVISGMIAGTASSDSGTQSLYSAKETENTKPIDGEVASTYGIFIDLESDTILAERNGTARINPASMTKVLTVLVAAEHVENLDDTFTMTLDITDYGYVHDCSSVGFLEGEEVTVRDLFYGTILPSGADAAVGLATYVAGSQEAFVELMNEKLKELGLSDTAHMTNCVGIYDEEHYCTPYDMAMIMEAAVENELCREVMNTRTYTTSLTEQHPEGITISNWFLRRIEDKDTGGEVICGKTGYVVQSGSCAVSYGRDHNGKEYVCVTADANSSWRCIYDHVALYSQFSTAKEDNTDDTEGSGNAS